MSSLTDIALVAQVVTLGSQRAFATLVERHQESVRRFLRSLTHGDEALADDLAQETFIRAWQGLRGFHGSASFRTWVMRIAYRLYLDEQRRQRNTTSISGCEELSTDTPERTSLRSDIHQALATLSEAERTCVVLQLVEGRSIADIAAVTGFPQNTVKSHLLRGKRHLTDYLRRNGYQG